MSKVLRLGTSIHASAKFHYRFELISRARPLRSEWCPTVQGAQQQSMRQTMALRASIETLLWYAGRPAYLPNLVHITKSRLFGKIRGQTAAESLAWCKVNAVSSAEALRHLFPQRALSDVEKIFPGDMAFAKAQEAACPTKM